MLVDTVVVERQYNERVTMDISIVTIGMESVVELDMMMVDTVVDTLNRPVVEDKATVAAVVYMVVDIVLLVKDMEEGKAVVGDMALDMATRFAAIVIRNIRNYSKHQKIVHRYDELQSNRVERRWVVETFLVVNEYSFDLLNGYIYSWDEFLLSRRHLTDKIAIQTRIDIGMNKMT